MDRARDRTFGGSDTFWKLLTLSVPEDSLGYSYFRGDNYQRPFRGRDNVRQVASIVSRRR